MYGKRNFFNPALGQNWGAASTKLAFYAGNKNLIKNSKVLSIGKDFLASTDTLITQYACPYGLNTDSSDLIDSDFVNLGGGRTARVTEMKYNILGVPMWKKTVFGSTVETFSLILPIEIHVHVGVEATDGDFIDTIHDSYFIMKKIDVWRNGTKFKATLYGDQTLNNSELYL